MARKSKPYKNLDNSRVIKNKKNNSKKDLEDTRELDNTTRIRIDAERLNDSDSLDTSFLEGRVEKKSSKKTKDKILKSTGDNSSIFNVLKIITLFWLTLTVLGLCIYIVFSMGFNKPKKEVKKSSNKSEVVSKEDKKNNKVIDDNVLFLGDYSLTNLDLDDFYYPKVVMNEKEYSLNKIKDDLNNKIYIYNPSVLFISLGNYDITNNSSIDEMISDYKEIINGVKNNRPYCDIYVLSLLPINESIDEFNSDLINEGFEANDISVFNSQLKRLCGELKVNYLDIYKELAVDDKLNDDYTDDGVNLNEDGYKRLFKIIRKVME